MSDFRNIDSFVPDKFERLGMLKGKRWYFDRERKIMTLFKPKRYEHGNKQVFCANHYGEVIGYILADGAGILACMAELAHLSKYYSNIHKERNNGTPEEKDGCITYNVLSPDEELELGKTVIEYFKLSKRDEYDKLTANDFENFANDNLEVVLASIEKRTRNFYEKKQDISFSYIEKKVAENKRAAIEMMVYDCLYGNNDRHDENWALKKGKNDISLYHLYDNERVLGLYENEDFVRSTLEKGTVEAVAEQTLFSRMRVPREKKSFSSYKDVLMYLVNNYREETLEALNKNLSSNILERVKHHLESCEGLPDVYIKFGTIMYQSRYDFAKQLCRKKHIDDIHKIEKR